MITTSTGSRRGSVATACTILTIGALVLTGCASDEESGAAGPSLDRFDADLYQEAVAAATEIAGDDELSGSIEFIGVNGGAEGEVLQGVYAAFTEATGVEVNYTGTQDINSIVQSRVQSGNAPDVVDQSIGVALDYAEQGELLNLSEIIGDDELAGSYNAGLIESASYDGSVFGVYQGFSNFMVWYNPTTYDGPTDPSTWQELADYTDEKAAAGEPAWCIAEEAGGGSGFPGAQFIENIFAKTYGPDMLNQWGSGELAWTSPEVKAAWEAFGDIATDDSKVSGGVAGSLSSAIATGYNGLVTDPATCDLALWGSWVPGLIGSTAIPGENIDFFPAPGANSEFGNTEIFQTTVTTAFTDSPEVQAFMKFIASTPAQALLASADQWPVANTNVPSSVYDSVLLKKAADTYFGDDVVLASGPNVMADAATSAAFYKGVISYLQDPSSLDSVLAGIESAANGG